MCVLTIIILMVEVVHIVIQLKTCSWMKEIVQHVTFRTVWIVRTILTVWSVMKVVIFMQRMVSVCTATTASMNLSRKETANHVRLWAVWTAKTLPTVLTVMKVAIIISTMMPVPFVTTLLMSSLKEKVVSLVLLQAV